MTVSGGILVRLIMMKPSVVMEAETGKEKGGELSEDRCELIIGPKATVCLGSHSSVHHLIGHDKCSWHDDCHAGIANCEIKHLARSLH